MTFYKKIGKAPIIFTILLIIGDIIELSINKRMGIEYLGLNILYLFFFISQYIKFINIKRRGIIQKQVRYEIGKEKFGNKEYKTLFAYINGQNGMEYKVWSPQMIKDTDNIPEKGFVDVLVDPKNYKNYFIYIETVNGRQ